MSSTGSRFMSTTAAPVPPRMKGVRRPTLVSLHLSDRLPNRGRRNSARMLSAAMMTPVRDSSMWKVFRRMRGTRLSYICQKEQMERKASPTRMVRLLFSFSSFMISPFSHTVGHGHTFFLSR